MRTMWGGAAVVLLLGCAPDAEADPQRSRDGGHMEGDASRNAAISCAPASATPSSARQHRALSVPELCTELARTGIRCPKDRAELMLKLDALCSDLRYPVLVRRCGTDLLMEYFDSSGRNRATWRFASDTGELTGAHLLLDDFVCGQGVYHAGQADSPCPEEKRAECKLCEGGEERDAKCPPEVVALLPSQPCAPFDGGPSCTCERHDEDVFEVHGTPCDPGQCHSCSSQGTCGATCTCMRDGKTRWQVWCGE